jgi:hypothetical protein
MLEVRDLLADTGTRSPFAVTLPPGARSVAGAERRAVTAVNDRANVFRFARLFREVTIVKGTSPFNDAAAQRLTKVLEPWGVRCKVVPLEEAAKSRALTEDEARTWVGLTGAGKGQIKPGAGNPPALVGFAVPGPVILLGNPDDHPIIRFLLTEKFLPCTPKADEFPGRGRGFVAWQRDGVGRGQESVTLIAYDEAGMSEAVGTLYEAVAGLDPLTKYEWPTADQITPAQKSLAPPAAEIAWTARLPDRVLSLQVEGGRVKALTHDGSVSTFSPGGQDMQTEALRPSDVADALKRMTPPADAKVEQAAQAQARPDRMLKLWAANGGRVAIAYWGGTLRIADGSGAVLAEQQLPQDVTALTWVDGQLVAGLADGRVLALKGK